MGVRGYELGHIDWAIKVEKSGLCTQDFLDKAASAQNLHYLTDEDFQSDVERARHFLFDELPLLGGTEFHEKLTYHLLNFTKEPYGLFNEIIGIIQSRSAPTK